MIFQFVTVGAELVVAEFDPNYKVSSDGCIVPISIDCSEIRLCREELERVLADPRATPPDAYRQALEQWPASAEGLPLANVRPGWDKSDKELP